MIKISKSNINSVRNDYYNKICKDVGTKLGLISRIEIEIVKKKSSKRIEFYNQLIKDITQDQEKNLIIGLPEYLEERKQFYQNKFGDILNKKTFRTLILNNCFFYGNYDKWGAYELSKALKVNVCPYCNRQYTFTLETSSGKTRPQFDHFFDKASYPYLSLSFYNLIPSCSICNSSLKGSEEFKLSTHMNPYIDSFSEDIKFSVYPFNIEFINGVSSEYNVVFKFGRQISKEKSKKAIGNIRTFKLRQLYNMHKDFIDELIIKTRIYNKEYINSLFKMYEGTLFNSVGDVKRMIVSNYIEEIDYDKRVLSKLTKDIAQELGLI